VTPDDENTDTEEADAFKYRGFACLAGLSAIKK
jgi:hypothetical protein